MGGGHRGGSDTCSYSCPRSEHLRLFACLLSGRKNHSQLPETVLTGVRPSTRHGVVCGALRRIGPRMEGGCRFRIPVYLHSTVLSRDFYFSSSLQPSAPTLSCFQVDTPPSLRPLVWEARQAVPSLFKGFAASRPHTFVLPSKPLNHFFFFGSVLLFFFFLRGQHRYHINGICTLGAT